MVNYKAIADAIPEAEMSAALAELAIERPLIKNEYSSKDVLVRGKVKKLFMPVLGDDGKQKTKPVLDENKKNMTAKGKFMDDIAVMSAFNAIKDMVHNVGTVEEPSMVLKFQGLKCGYVQNAIQQRFSGEI